MALTPIACFSVLMWTAATVGAQPEATRINVMEDEDVILPCTIKAQTIKAKGFDWKTQDKKEVFLYENGQTYNDELSGQDQQFRGRVFHFPDQIQSSNASIVIRGVKVADSGTYTCRIPSVSAEMRSIIQLTVGAAPRPYLTIVDQTKDGAILQCEVDGAFPEPRVEWQDSDGHILPSEEPQVSEKGGRFYITLQTTVTKSGNFRCMATQEEIFHQIYSETFVPLSGAASEPYVTILDQTKEQALLQCVVRGASPKPDVFWLDSSGKVLPAGEPKITERGGSYDIILQTTVTKTDRYRCVAKQEEINHQIHGEEYVHLNESPTGQIVVAALIPSVLLVGAVFVFVLHLKGLIKLKCDKDQQGPTSISCNAEQTSDQDSKQPLNN
ncbi:CD276 antigen homolog isoform 1-T2 [Menidia menidia]